ncbi:MAG: hypothetical protein HGB26_01445 [Desulfobulbaceae bacterium]|nr:hypothetical protein [Desulfobulbaceae bacterium]
MCDVCKEEAERRRQRNMASVELPAAASAGYANTFTPEWVAKQRDEWRVEALSINDLLCYRVNYDIPGWAKYRDSNYGGLFAACLAVERLCCEVERLRGCIIDCLNENGHLADGEICTLIDLKRAVPEWELD